MSKIKTFCSILETAANIAIVGSAAKCLYDKANDFFSSDDDDEESENNDNDDKDENESKSD